MLNRADLSHLKNGETAVFIETHHWIIHLFAFPFVVPSIPREERMDSSFWLGMERDDGLLYTSFCFGSDGHTNGLLSVLYR